MTDEDSAPSIIPAWECAVGQLEDALSSLRSVYPSRMMLLPETGHRAIREAMNDSQSAVANLHRAGRYVLGVEGYDDWLAERIANDL